MASISLEMGIRTYFLEAFGTQYYEKPKENNMSVGDVPLNGVVLPVTGHRGSRLLLDKKLNCIEFIISRIVKIIRQPATYEPTFKNPEVPQEKLPPLASFAVCSYGVI